MVAEIGLAKAAVGSERVAEDRGRVTRICEIDVQDLGGVGGSMNQQSLAMSVLGVGVLSVIAAMGTFMMAVTPDHVEIEGATFRYKGIRFCGHADGVLRVAVSPSGRHVASLSMDHSIRVWDAGTGACLWSDRGGWGWFEEIGFSEDGDYVGARHGADRYCWDVQSGRLVRKITSSFPSPE